MLKPTLGILLLLFLMFSGSVKSLRNQLRCLPSSKFYTSCRSSSFLLVRISARDRSIRPSLSKCISSKQHRSELWSITARYASTRPIGELKSISKNAPAASSLKTGAFKRDLPDVLAGPYHFRRAVRQMKRTVKLDNSIKNTRNAYRKHSAQSMDALMKGLTVPITELLNAYKSTFRKLHPFEATVADLTLTARMKRGLPDLQDMLAEVKALRAKTSRIAKMYANRANNAASAAEAKELLAKGMSALEAVYDETLPIDFDSEDADDNKLSDIDSSSSSNVEIGLDPDVVSEAVFSARCLSELIEIQKDLRKIPTIDLQTPTLVLVGAPNVGKSSIVRAISSGTPEVNNYPFTTRGVSVGHIMLRSPDASQNSLRFQVMDTPGLLDRPEEERNEMERLTYASLAHLPTAVMFVLDTSGESSDSISSDSAGDRLSSLRQQLNVRSYLKGRFPLRPWIDVVSKCDLLESEELQNFTDAVNQIKGRGHKISETLVNQIPDGAIHVSVATEVNVEGLRDEVHSLLLELRTILQARGIVAPY